MRNHRCLAGRTFLSYSRALSRRTDSQPDAASAKGEDWIKQAHHAKGHANRHGEDSRDVPLAPHSNYRIGGPARYFCEATNEEEIRAGVLFAREQNLQLFVLGGGTNLLISDSGFDGLMLKPSSDAARSGTEMW